MLMSAGKMLFLGPSAVLTEAGQEIHSSPGRSQHPMCCAQCSFTFCTMCSGTVGSACTHPVDTVLVSLATRFAGVRVKWPASPPGLGLQWSSGPTSALSWCFESSPAAPATCHSNTDHINVYTWRPHSDTGSLWIVYWDIQTHLTNNKKEGCAWECVIRNGHRSILAADSMLAWFPELPPWEWSCSAHCPCHYLPCLCWSSFSHTGHQPVLLWSDFIKAVWTCVDRTAVRKMKQKGLLGCNFICDYIFIKTVIGRSLSFYITFKYSSSNESAHLL